MVEHDEALKGAPDVERSQAHFSLRENDEALKRFRNTLETDFYSVADEVNSQATRPKLLEFLRSKDFSVQLPTWNEGDTVGGILDHMIKQMGGPERILLMDANSTDNTAEVARDRGVKPILQADVYKCVKSDKLFDVLDEQNPRGRGMTIYAFWLYRTLITEEFPTYTCFVDTDIRNFPEYDPLPFMAYPIVTRPDENFISVKVAKPGRGNEPVMCGRCILQVFGKLGERYFNRLARDMWMISGEYVVQPKLMKSMPHATRSFVDTITSFDLADLAEGGKGKLALVAVPNSRLDKKNDNMKEQVILYSIPVNMAALVNFGTPASELTIKQIAQLNREVFPKYSVYPYIPDQPGVAMQAACIVNDRILPSVDQLIANDMIDTAAVKEVKQKYLG